MHKVIRPLPRQEFRKTEPVGDPLPCFLNRSGSMNKIFASASHHICQVWRVNGEVATNRAGRCFVGQGMPNKLAHNVYGVDALKHHRYYRTKHQVAVVPLLDLLSDCKRISRTEDLDGINAIFP